MPKPDFLTLEALPGVPERRQVAGTWMDREQYDMEGWHVISEYVEGGKTHRYWKAELVGLRRYGRLVHQRHLDSIKARELRNEADDEFTAYVDALEDAKPTR